MTMLKTTPIFEEYQKHKARIIPFGSWKMPLEFSLGSKKEHLHVREHVGLFDVSHMGEIRVFGEEALEFLSQILTNQSRQLKENECQYNLLCHHQGGVIDDLILYCVKPSTNYLLCVNAKNIQKDFKWMMEQKSKNLKVQIQNESDEWGQVAVQGPHSKKLLQKIFRFEEIKKFTFLSLDFENTPHLISRTGYTGEDGFEILSPHHKTKNLWRTLLKEGSSLKALPIGLAARNTLRMEMKYPLCGVDMDESVTPLEMGLKWACGNPCSFIGKDNIFNKKVLRKWVGFEMLENSGIPRTRCPIYSKDKKLIGTVTSGALSPSLNKMIGLALVQSTFSNIDQEWMIQIHGDLAPAKVVPTPFVTQTSLLKN